MWQQFSFRLSLLALSLMLKVCTNYFSLIYSVTPRYAVGWLGCIFLDFILVPLCMVTFKVSFIDIINKDSLKSNYRVIVYHAYLFDFKAPPTKCKSSFHKLTNSSMALSNMFFIFFGIKFT